MTFKMRAGVKLVWCLGAGGVMAAREYTIFDSGVGPCAIAWSRSGIIGVQLPLAREIETRKRLFALYPDAREVRAPANVETAIEGIVALLRGEPADFSEVTLDMTGIPAFNQRVYAFARTIPHRETLTYSEIASKLRVSGAVRSVTQALSRNPFVVIVPCHRVLEAGDYADGISPHAGAISKRRLLSIEGARGRTNSKTLFEVLLPVAPPRPQG
jgi:methylated-DNA-[protein]-cysteine S-methyltransferase